MKKVIFALLINIVSGSSFIYPAMEVLTRSNKIRGAVREVRQTLFATVFDQVLNGIRSSVEQAELASQFSTRSAAEIFKHWFVVELNFKCGYIPEASEFDQVISSTECTDSDFCLVHITGELSLFPPKITFLNGQRFRFVSTEVDRVVLLERITDLKDELEQLVYSMVESTTKYAQNHREISKTYLSRNGFRLDTFTSIPNAVKFMLTQKVGYEFVTVVKHLETEIDPNTQVLIVAFKNPHGEFRVPGELQKGSKKFRAVVHTGNTNYINLDIHRYRQIVLYEPTQE